MWGPEPGVFTAGCCGMTRIMDAPTDEISTESVVQVVTTEGNRGFRGLIRNADVKMHPHDYFVDVVSRHIDMKKQPEWLDVGCGWHFDWPWEQKREEGLVSRANVTGLDPDTQAVARHRSIRKKVVGSVERLPFADESFDIVTANVVVEHLKYPGVAFSEVFRVLRPGGVFLFRTPSARSYFVRIARVLPRAAKLWLAGNVIAKRKEEDIYPTHYRANTAEVITELCGVLGFRKVDVTITRAMPTFNNIPVIRKVERFTAGVLGITEGNLIAEAYK